MIQISTQKNETASRHFDKYLDKLGMTLSTPLCSRHHKTALENKYGEPHGEQGTGIAKFMVEEVK